MNVDGILAVIGTPIVEDLIRLDGKPLDLSLPKHLVKAASWDDWLDEDEEDIRIIDFGESFPKNTRVESLAQPGQLRVPETVFVGSFDYRVDLWRVGCIVGYLRTPWKRTSG
ncbi:Autophagy protein 5 [Paecilomyces lecythidis]